MTLEQSNSSLKTKTVQMDLCLHRAQQEINSSKARFNVAMCGGRFGKTTLALWKLIERAGLGNSPNWYVAPTYRQAKMIAWLKLLSMLPPGVIAKKNETELYVELKNRTRIELKGADNEDTLRGVPLSSVVFDETPFIRRHVWEEIIMPRTVDYVAPVWFIGTPSLGKDWFYKLYLKGQDTTQSEWRSFHYTILDNPYLDKQEVEKLRLGMNPTLWRQECLAEPTGISGLVYPGFEHSFHVVKPFEIPADWRKARAMDWGRACPMCCLFGAEDPRSGNIYIYREHYQDGWTSKKHASVIRNIEPATKWEFSVMDPSAFKEERDGGSVSDDFIRAGVVVRKADNTVNRGIDVVNRYLTETPKVFFFNNCVHTLDEITIYIYPSQHGEMNRKEVPVKKDDHAMDTLRYLLVEFDRMKKRTPYRMSSDELRKKIMEQTEVTQRLPINRKHGYALILNSEGYINA